MVAPNVVPTTSTTLPVKVIAFVKLSFTGGGIAADIRTPMSSSDKDKNIDNFETQWSFIRVNLVLSTSTLFFAAINGIYSLPFVVEQLSVPFRTHESQDDRLSRTGKKGIISAFS